jgi:hypothetical protein
MERIKIKNWDTAPYIINNSYNKGLKIKKTEVHMDNQYIYRFFDSGIGIERLAIGISRKPSGDVYVVRGKTFSGGKYSNIYKVTKQQLGQQSHIRFVFNRIIDEVC